MFLLTRFSHQKRFRSLAFAQGVFSILWVALLTPTAQAGMSSLTEAELSDVAGAGIAIALDDFAYMMAPTSYFEQVGSAPAGACTSTGNGAGNQDCWRRGDLRWYGASITAVSETGSHWTESACASGDFMSCPRGGPIADFSPFDNPYVMRAWSPEGMDYQGALINEDPSAPEKTIYEFLAPTSQPDYMLSFWGEIEAGATRDPASQALSEGAGGANPTGGGLLKSQTTIRGNAAGSVFRLFKFTETGASPLYGETFGMMYTSYLKGDFRFTVEQAAGSSNAIGDAPIFRNIGGLYFRNVEAFIPLGQLYYQALVLNAVGTGGDFSLELTRIPNNPTVYNRHYGLLAGDTMGYETARWHVNNLDAACPDQNCTNYRTTHGHIRYGDWDGSAATRNTIDGYEDIAPATPGDQGDGIFFRACSDCAPFRAYASRSLVIDKRGPTESRQRTQNYQCNTGNTGGCVVDGSGPVVAESIGDYSRTFPTQNVNLGDARMEGLLINRFELISCQSGGC